MLQDMRYTCAVHGSGPKPNTGREKQAMTNMVISSHSPMLKQFNLHESTSMKHTCHPFTTKLGISQVKIRNSLFCIHFTQRFSEKERNLVFKTVA